LSEKISEVRKYVYHKHDFEVKIYRAKYQQVAQ